MRLRNTTFFAEVFHRCLIMLSKIRFAYQSQFELLFFPSVASRKCV